MLRGRKRGKRARTALLLAAAIAGPSISCAQVQRFYVGNGANWNTTSSWSTTAGGPPGASVPVNGDTATVSTATSFSILFDGGYASPGLAGLLLNGSGATVTLAQSASTMAAQLVTLGSSGAAAYAQSGGTHSVGSSLVLGSNAGSIGRYSLAGGRLAVGGEALVGNSGNGTFTQSAGTHTIGSFLGIGYSAGSSGTYTLSGGLLAVSTSEIVGNSGSGIFSHTGGTNLVGSDLFIGAASGPGTYSLSGTAALSVSGYEYLGLFGAGLFHQSGGTHSVNVLKVAGPSTYVLSGGALNLANGLDLDGMMSGGGAAVMDAGAGGILDLAHGTLSSTSQLSIHGSPNTLVIFPAGFNPATQLANYSNSGVTGFGGSVISIPAGKTILGAAMITDALNVSGTLGERGGTLTLAGGLTVGTGGSVTASDVRIDNPTSGMSGGSLNVTSFTYVGYDGAGAFNQGGGNNSTTFGLLVGFNTGSSGAYLQSGGTNTVASELVLARYAGSTGTYTLSGSASLSTATEYVGDGGAAVFHQSGGVHNVGSELNIAFSAGSTGTLNLSAGRLAVSRSEFVGISGSGVFNHSGGTHTVGSHLTLAGNGGASGTYSLSSTASLSVSGHARVGNAGNGLFGQSGGTSNIAMDLSIGVNSGARGTYTHTGGTSTIGQGLYLGFASSAAGSYLLSGSARLSVSGNEYIGHFGAGAFNQTGGTHSAAGSIHLGHYAGSSGAYSMSGGTLTTPTLEVNHNSIFNHMGGTLNVAALQLQGGGILNVASRAASGGSNRPLYVNSLSIDADGGSALDLNDNDLVVSYGTNPSVFNQVRDWVFNGYAASPEPGKTGIISSTGQSAGNTILAVIDNALIGAGDWPLGSGNTIETNSVIGKYTYFGDANFDGQVTPDDYGVLDANLGATPDAGVAWLSGDANLDGTVDANDYGVLDANLGSGVGAPLGASAVSVPEPAGLALILLPLLRPRGRRRRH